MLKPVTIGPLKISAVTRAEFLTEISKRLQAAQKTWITTPYSEFLYAALRSGEVRDMLAKADVAIADGIGIFWAERFLSKPLRLQSHVGKILESWVYVIITGARILLSPSYLYKNLPEKITGASVFVDMVAEAHKLGKSIYLLGNWGDSAKKTAKMLEEKFPGLKVAGASNKSAEDKSVFSDLDSAKPDMLFVGFGPIRQERWIYKNLDSLPATIIIGVGGTFDYFSGNQLRPPLWVRDIGLEWLFRLITQPKRIGRIFRATIGLIVSLVRYKVFATYPYRDNAVPVAVNSENKVLLCKRINKVMPGDSKDRSYYSDYWQFPQGGIDDGENVIDAARRELKEETGIISAELLGVAQNKNSYEWVNGNRRVWFNSRVYKGQEQQTVFFKFTGQDSELKIDNLEFDDFGWYSFDELLSKIAPERRAHAEAVLMELQDILRNPPK